jgi:hypothetical protein
LSRASPLTTRKRILEKSTFWSEFPHLTLLARFCSPIYPSDDRQNGTRCPHRRASELSSRPILSQPWKTAIVSPAAKLSTNPVLQHSGSALALHDVVFARGLGLARVSRFARHARSSSAVHFGGTDHRHTLDLSFRFRGRLSSLHCLCCKRSQKSLTYISFRVDIQSPLVVLFRIFSRGSKRQQGSMTAQETAYQNLAFCYRTKCLAASKATLSSL